MTTTRLSWIEDTLGPDFQQAPLPLGPDPDGEAGPVSATLIRYNPGGDADSLTQRPALVWVHGMTDYFFHRHVAEYFHDKGYAFYAVDLRKCGRSRTEGQTWHYISDFKYYTHDLNAMVDALPNQQIGIMGHSTAGAIVSLWLDELRRTDPTRFARVTCVIYNSPWLAMMGMPNAVYEVAKHAIFAASKAFPHWAIPAGDLTTFGESIHSSQKGEWDFDLEKKPMGGHAKQLGWLAAVFRSFDKIHSGRIDIGKPLLTLTSTRTELGKPYSESTNTADVVVDMRQSQRWAKELSSHYTLRAIEGARHDVFLSRKPARDEALTTSIEWLSRVMPAN